MWLRLINSCSERREKTRKFIRALNIGAHQEEAIRSFCHDGWVKQKFLQKHYMDKSPPHPIIRKEEKEAIMEIMDSGRILFHAIIVFFPLFVVLVFLLPFHIKSYLPLSTFIATIVTWFLWLWIQPYDFAAGVVFILATWIGYLLGRGPAVYPRFAIRALFTTESLTLYKLIAHNLAFQGRLITAAVPMTLTATWFIGVLYEWLWLRGYGAVHLSVLGACCFYYGVTIASLLNKMSDKNGNDNDKRKSIFN